MSKFFLNLRMGWLARRKRAFKRKDLMDKFDISEAQATRDIRHFIKLNPNRLQYSVTKKRYVPESLKQE